MNASRGCTPARLIVTATLVVLISACAPEVTPSHAPKPDPNRFAALEADAKIMSHRWTAPDTIDLDLPEMQVARGYIESENNYARTADPLTLYPGYTDVAHVQKSPPTPRTGTINHHILQVEPTAHLGQPASEIHVCSTYMQTGVPTDTGWARLESLSYVSLRIQSSGTMAVTTPPVDNERRLSFPAWNVFDGWEVERFTDKRMGENDPWRVCMSRMPGFDYDAPLKELLPAAPVVEPFYPGWPTLVDDDE